MFLQCNKELSGSIQNILMRELTLFRSDRNQGNATPFPLLMFMRIILHCFLQLFSEDFQILYKHRQIKPHKGIALCTEATHII